MRLLLLGPPGAGKGTQAAILSTQLGVPHISTGALFRAHIGDGTPLGRQVEEYLDSGALVPDEITNKMVRERLAQPDAEPGFVLDGFPRNIAQAHVLDMILGGLGRPIGAVLELQVPEDELVERLRTRGRQDDTDDVIRHRQQVYREETAPLLDYYSERLITVPAVGSVEEVTERALDALRTRT